MVDPRTARGDGRTICTLHTAQSKKRLGLLKGSEWIEIRFNRSSSTFLVIDTRQRVEDDDARKIGCYRKRLKLDLTSPDAHHSATSTTSGFSQQ